MWGVIIHQDTLSGIIPQPARGHLENHLYEAPAVVLHFTGNYNSLVQSR
jgi:hypothetical protein